MDYKLFFVSFIAIFLAELGDKTQLATMGFAAQNPSSKWIIFAASAIALTASSLIGVLLGGKIADYISPDKIKIASAVLFIMIGSLLIFDTVYNTRAKKIEKIVSFIVQDEVRSCHACSNFQMVLRESNIDNLDKYKLTDNKCRKAPEKRCKNCNALKLKEYLKSAIDS